MTKAEIVMYKSSYCGHSLAVESFMKRHQIPVELINIDGDAEARQTVMSINNGFASVPTLVFPDGSHLTEPSFRQLRARLNIESVGLVDRLRRLFGSS